jgi:dsDNA-binding SOS-regulon protein
MPADEWDAYDEMLDEPDDPDEWRDQCDDPSREDFAA